MATMMQNADAAHDKHRFPLGKIRLLHKAIREKVARIANDVQNLGPLSPDAHLVDIDRGIEILEEIVLSHCKAEDITLLPALNEKTKLEPVDLDACDAGSSAPPAKRPRTSPVGVNIAHSTEDHGAIAKSIESLKHVLKYACYGLEPDFEATPIALHRSRYGFFGGPRATREPWQSPLTGLSRKTILDRIKDEARSLADTISTHLDLEERDLFPIWKKYFSPDEQGPLLVKTILLSTSANWPRTFGYLNTEDLSSLFEDVAFYASDKELLEISTRAAPYISNESWRTVCGRVPKLSKCERPVQNPLMEIAYIRLAMCNELRDLVPCCENLDITCKSQLESFTSRFAFVEQIHSFLSDGEKKVLLPKLSAGLEESPCASLSFSLIEYQRNRDEVMGHASKLNRRMVRLSDNQPSPNDVQREMNALVQEFTRLSNLMVAHLKEAEKHLHPLIGKHFGTKEQESIIGRIMSSMPEDVMHDLVLRMFSLVSIDDLESVLRYHARRVSAAEFNRTVLTLVSSVQKGSTNARDWAELCSRLPELRPYAKETDDLLTREEHGPVSEILRVHKAIRVELNVLLLRTKALPVDGSLPNRLTLRSIAARVAFLRRMVDDHSKAEDDILLPRLEERKPGSTSFFMGEHCNERVLFGVVAKALEDLECVTDGTESTQLVWRLRVAARTLRDEMTSHLAKEEEELWPLVKTLFTREEQSKIVALIFGNMPGDRLRELLPWMIRVLSVSERNEMIQHILEVTRSTMFEKWLKTWLPLDDGADIAPRAGNGRASSSDIGKRSGSPLRSGVDCGKSKLDYVKQMLQHGRDSIQHVIKQIARDESIDMETRTRLMQDVMLAPFTKLRDEREAAKNQGRNEDDNLEPTYTLNQRNEMVLGCSHYQRGVKLRAACCDRLYTCRRCHDAEELHEMDRYATFELMCMACFTLQPVSEKCINDKCRRLFAKYFCSVCKLYDDDDSHTLYHCHYCNICRVGKGLGEDFFHCMKCNQCMNLEFQKAGHKCRENAMESDCPVCYEYLFTSTARVKYLKCGHAMHESCRKLYLRSNYRCPHCSKSLTDMQPYFRQIDGAVAAQEIPKGYRNKKLEVLCHDCELRSITGFHFIYHKCQECKGYNTRVIRERAENELVRVLPATMRSGKGSGARECAGEVGRT